MHKTVAVVGAGVSGIVAAKSLLEVGLLPTVFDKRSRIGGLWDPEASRAWSTLHTNLSCYTCCFSDFPWKSTSPVYPSQKDVSGYLNDYVSHFKVNDHLHLSSEVTEITLGKNGKPEWMVEWQENDGRKSSKAFDYVVVATGYFASPNIPPIGGLETFTGVKKHSSEFSSPLEFRGLNTLVVGGSITGVELSGEIAQTATRCTHAATHPFWVLPRYLPESPKRAAPPFLPIDLVFYRRSSHPTPHEIQIHKPEENKKINDYFRALCGEQGVYTPPEGTTDPAFVTVSDTYSTLTKVGKIDVQMGRVTKVRGKTIILDNNKEIPDIDALLFCTGYKPFFPFFSSAILSQIQFDPTDVFQPLLLHRNVFHPALPNLAFVGMYRGPYFGIQELQSRWIASVFSGKTDMPSEKVQREGIECEARIRAHRPREQFPHSDYVGLSDALASEIGYLPPSEWRVSHNVVVPAHYRTGPEAEKAVREIEEDIVAMCAGKFIAAAVFRALGGEWNLKRKITDRKGWASGKVKGTAVFLPTSSYNEFLYTENGSFTSNAGTNQITRSYIYAYDAGTDHLEVFFEKDKQRDNLFNTLYFLPNETKSKSSDGWRAQSHHSCSPDTYQTSYCFSFQGIRLKKIEITHVVTGPEKDYTSVTYLTPK